jgi:asparagine synthase (glutamine-hydrolysing)
MNQPTAVDALFATPGTEHVVSDGADWFVAGTPHAALRSLVREAPDYRTVRERAPAVADDAALVRVAPAADATPTVAVLRSATASRPLYVCRASDDRLVLTDAFRNAVAALDPADRRVPRAALADHLLFRTPVEPLTYLDRVRAPVRGAWFEWSPADGDPVSTPERPHAVPCPAPVDPATRHTPSAALDAVDGALAASLPGTGAGVEPGAGSQPSRSRTASRSADGLATAFSGGVDSTLLHTYLPKATPTLTWGVDSPEFGFELDYAAESAARTGGPTRRVVVDEGTFADRLVRSVRTLGLPTHYAQTTLMDAALRDRQAAGIDRLVCGAEADALFGIGGTKGLRLASWLAPAVGSPVGRLAGRLPGRLGDDALALRRYAAMLDRPPADPGSFPVRSLCHADPERVGRLVGGSLVADRLRTQQDAVGRLVGDPVASRLGGADGSAPDRFAAAAEAAHLCCLFGHDHLRHWRQVAAAHGVSLLAPFATRRLTECALSVPADRRYVPSPRRALARRSLRPKYLLKTLLGRRRPSYPTERPKGSGALPIGRYLADGPLAGTFDRYELPAVVTRPARERIVAGDAPVAWNLLTYAVWRDEVLEARNVGLMPGTRTVSRSIGARV